MSLSASGASLRRRSRSNNYSLQTSSRHRHLLGGRSALQPTTDAAITAVPHYNSKKKKKTCLFSDFRYLSVDGRQSPQDDDDDDRRTTTTNISSGDHVHDNSAETLFDGWIQLQRELLMDDDDDDDHPTTNLSSTTLKQICEAAERAHLVLERLYPSLAGGGGINNHHRMMIAAGNHNKNNNNNNQDDDDSLSTPLWMELSSSRLVDVTATARCNAVLEAWARAARAAATISHCSTTATTSRLTRSMPQRAQYLLEQMEQSSLYQQQHIEMSADQNELDDQQHANTAQSGTATDVVVVVRPSVESYNHVMEAWAYSREHLRGTMAEQVFQKVKASPSSSLRPDGESYRLAIRAWAWSQERRAAFMATGHLMKMLRKLDHQRQGRQGQDEDDTMEPLLEDYKIVLQAWTMARDKASPRKAFSVLHLMDTAFEKGTTQNQPDYDCFKYLLLTAAKRPQLDDLGVQVDNVLARMATRLMVPDTECYGAAIRTWKNAAWNPDLVEYRDRSVKRTLELLAEMRVAHHQSSTVSVEPTTEIINDVIQTLSVSNNPRRTEQAERLLFEMEEGTMGESNGSLGAKPNADTYAFVINVWKSSKSTEQVPRAKAILWRMEENYQDLVARNPNSCDDEFIGVFNAFIRVCGSAVAKTQDRRTEVLREAFVAFEAIRSLEGLEPNAETYTVLLEACERLVSPGRDRQAAIEKVFSLCCADGMVDENVLLQLRSCASPEQYTELVVSVSETIDGTKMVPEAWTINALGGRVVTADGRKTKPLSIQGKLTVTTAMQDFQMRRMRDKRNRNLLRGGRQSNDWKKRVSDVV